MASDEAIAEEFSLTLWEWTLPILKHEAKAIMNLIKCMKIMRCRRGKVLTPTPWFSGRDLTPTSR